jgi:hypothetical protein
MSRGFRENLQEQVMGKKYSADIYTVLICRCYGDDMEILWDAMYLFFGSMVYC